MDYTMSKYKRSVLSEEECHFFYYDIIRNQEDNIRFVYDWNEDIQDYLDSKGIVIEVREENDLPETVEKNRLYFAIIEKDEKNKAIAFFRHLRNAFAHLQIVREGEYMNITDGFWEGEEENKHFEKTMIGQIKYEDLKELCFLFFKQGNELTEKK